ncbi:thaumatin [Radiomyces spectabilis]|uniref:thaumatin n=1 Tax=Radiomyces spectabilis TaxID=64574 RepID=UPI002220E68E|nr:thaumatin [Radiomyces spectabilis]KAI8391281.1 thaumatin [Radiomyces spectabilis]
MHMLAVLFIALGFFCSLVAANNKQVEILNKCGKTLTVGVLTNGASKPEQSFDLTPHASQTISKQDTWGGRIWGRYQCSGAKSAKCTNPPGADNPASLAEFFFKGAYGKDFYDISFVDGYNLPMKIEPIDPSHTKGYTCGAPACNKMPDCPPEYAIKDATGNVVSCQSSCSKTGAAEHCCTGQYDHPEICKPDHRSNTVKDTCPDAYSFAYDDQKSTYQCTTQKYVVTFC